MRVYGLSFLFTSNSYANKQGESDVAAVKSLFVKKLTNVTVSLLPETGQKMAYR